SLGLLRVAEYIPPALLGEGEVRGVVGAPSLRVRGQPGLVTFEAGGGLAHQLRFLQHGADELEKAPRSLAGRDLRHGHSCAGARGRQAPSPWCHRTSRSRPCRARWRGGCPASVAPCRAPPNSSVATRLPRPPVRAALPCRRDRPQIESPAERSAGPR